MEENAVVIDHQRFGAAVAELESLIQSRASEAALQRHLELHPYILSQQFSHCHHVFPKVRLGSQYETDFLCLDIPSSGHEWRGVELEIAHKQVVTRAGRKSALLEHSLQQIRDWRHWTMSNLAYARAPKENNGLGLKDIHPRFDGYVVIGRRSDANAAYNAIRNQVRIDEGIEIRSWDGIVERAKERAEMFASHLASIGRLKKRR